MLNLNYPGSKRYENNGVLIFEVPIKQNWFYMEFSKTPHDGQVFQTFRLNNKSYLDSDDGEFYEVTVQELLERVKGASKLIVLALLLSCCRLQLYTELYVPVDKQFIIHWIVDNYSKQLLFPTEQDLEQFNDWYMFSTIDSTLYLGILLKRLKNNIML